MIGPDWLADIYLHQSLEGILQHIFTLFFEQLLFKDPCLAIISEFVLQLFNRFLRTNDQMLRKERYFESLLKFLGWLIFLDSIGVKNK